MATFTSIPAQPISRRQFFKTSMCGAAGVALYSGEIERHWIDVTRRDFKLRNLPGAFEGLKIAQLSDIHLDEFTEPFLLHDAIDHINRLQPDIVLLTGDYVTYQLASRDYAVKSSWQCAEMLNTLKCKERYAILGNHDAFLGENEVAAALTANQITVLKNSYLPIERRGSRIWLAGLDDTIGGEPDLGVTIPESIRSIAGEPIILMCHEPDFVDTILAHPAGKSVDLMLSGHTHGGQVRLPFVGALELPIMGKKYVKGRFEFGGLQLYVNRGLGTIGVPFRFDCPPEITSITLRRA
jgi:hypothetical protein